MQGTKSAIFIRTTVSKHQILQWDLYNGTLIFIAIQASEAYSATNIFRKIFIEELCAHRKLSIEILIKETQPVV